MTLYENYPEELGFCPEPTGTHTSRTLMLPDARRVFDTGPADESYDGICRRVLELNVLQRRSVEGRRRAVRILRELYGLRPELPVYRALRYYWQHSSESEKGVLALLCAASRDALLRTATAHILAVAPGQPVQKAGLEEYLKLRFPGRFTDDVRARTVRNLRSSWTQSGHLTGRVHKLRSPAPSGAASAAYAAFLGYLQGVRGKGLLETFWTRCLDTDPAGTESLLRQAWQRGLLTFNRALDVVEVSFPEDLLAKGR